nr:ABC transporter substrate-binding protein [Arcanobacterium pluranimalium]
MGVTALSACSTGKENTTTARGERAHSFTVKNCGKDQVFEKTPQKVLSMGVTGLAFLVAAGAEEKIAGRANELGEKPAKWIGDKAKDVKILADQNLSIESLVSFKPDLVYGGGFDSNGASPDAVLAKKIPAVVDSPECHYYYPDQREDESFQAILKEISMLGQLLGTAEKAEKTVEQLRAKIKEVESEKPGRGRKVAYAYYFGDDDGLFSYGTKGVMGEISKTLNLTSAIDPNYHPHQGPIAPEAFVKSDPDLIVVLVGMGGATKENSLARLEKIPGYQNMRAVKNKQIFFADSAMAYASPSALYGAFDLAKQIQK